MKIKSGFVSNSSTTSFAVYGVSFTQKEIDELIKNFNIEDSDYYDFLDDMFKNDKGITYAYSEETDSIYLGRDLNSIRKDETAIELITSTEKIIKERLKLDKKFTFLVEEISC